MSKLKKFRGTSDNGNVEFHLDNLFMTIRNERTDLITCSALLTDGQTAVTKRIANNLTDETDIEVIIRDWLKTVTTDGSDDLSADLKYNIYANHNIVNMGRIIILDGGAGGVQLQRDHKGKVFPVSRYADAFIGDVKDKAVEELKKANVTLREDIAEILADLSYFAEGSETRVAMESEYLDKRGQQSLNSLKISCLQTPHIAGMSTAYVSTNEEEIKEAFKNAKLDFNKFFPNGLDFGVDTTVQSEETSLNTGVETKEEKKEETVVTNPAQQIEEEMQLGTK